MKKLITFFTGRPIAVIMLVLAVLMGGGFAVRLLPLDRLPEIIFPRVTVETAYPGMGAAEVRMSVTIPLEDSLSAVKGLESIKSISRDSSSLLILTFRWGTRPAQAAALVREAIDTVYPGLPFGVSKPAVLAGDPSSEPHVIVAIRSLDGNNSFARNLAEYELRARLRRIDGAGAVIVSGGEKQEIHIRSDPARLAAFSLDGNDLAGIIAYETADFPAGSAREGNRELTVVSSGRPRSELELSSLVVSTRSGPLRISNLASVGREAASRDSLFIFNGFDQTALEIYRRPGADPVGLSREIKKVVKESAALFSQDVEISLVYDSSPSIVRGISDLGTSGGFAALAVILLLTIFLGRLSSSLLAALSLPVSASAAVIVLALTGRSLNTMSLGGLALGIGLVSDTSVIVLDLLCRNIIFGKKAVRFSGKMQITEEAGALTASVSLSSMSGALTSMIVFIPVIFLPGPLGALFGDLALALISSVAAGWLYAQFCLPALFCFFIPRRKITADKKSGKKTGGSGKMERVYSSLLKKALRRPVPVFIAAVFISVSGLFLFYFLPLEFLAPDRISEIEVTVDFPHGTPPEEALARGIEISGVLSELPFLSLHFGKMGAEPDDLSRRSDPDYRKEKLLYRCFLESGVNAEDAMEEIRITLRDHLNGSFRENNDPVSISVAYPPDRSAEVLGLSPAMTLAVRGGSLEETQQRAALFEDNFRQRAGLSLEFIRQRPSGTSPQIRLHPRREQAASAGISASQIAASLYAASEGIVTGEMEINGRPLAIRVSAGMSDYNQALNARSRLESFPLLRYSEDENTRPVFLGSLVDIEWIEAETALIRQDRSDTIYLDLFPSAGSNGKIQNLITEISAEGGWGISKADESVFARYRTALITTVLLVLLLLYFVLGAQFESFLLPVILMFSVPFSLAGAGTALFFSGSFLDSGAVLGLVALFGLSVNNGIIFFEISEEKIRSGLSPVRAVYEGAVLRFRPVLLTTMTTVFALLPLVISPLGNSQRSMAFTMLGGIIVSGLFAFFIFPPVYVRFFNRRKELQG